MIKVVGRNEQAVYRTTCGKCASILEYTKADTYTARVVDYTGCAEIEHKLQCPVCGGICTVGFFKQ